jgi:hypothetical protein
LASNSATPAPGGRRPPLVQWVQLASGRWISEKDPGYPFLAAPFQALGIIRLAPLCYGAFGCLGLFFGARRWLGRFGGGAAVGLFCTSGAALLFAWRDYMPTFTDASLIAAGTGALLGAWLLVRGPRRPALAAATSVAVVAAMFGLGVWSFGDMRVNQGPQRIIIGRLQPVPAGNPQTIPQADAPAHAHT